MNDSDELDFGNEGDDDAADNQNPNVTAAVDTDDTDTENNVPDAQNEEEDDECDQPKTDEEAPKVSSNLFLQQDLSKLSIKILKRRMVLYKVYFKGTVEHESLDLCLERNYSL